MRYFFLLGNNQALSVAELASVLGEDIVNTGFLSSSKALVIDLPARPDSRELIRILGGTVKVGSIIDEADLESLKPDSLLGKLKNHLNPQDGKFKFGLSVYGQIRIPAKELAMQAKKHLKAKGVNSRWVTSREKELSSVVVEQNKLITQGAEFVFLKQDGKVLIGRTEAVQPFKELSYRDYGRPARDDESGMLPPKLAQIMINLSQADKKDLLWDPFCGSGTVLTEAALMGYLRLRGTDVSSKAVSDTRKNLEWVKDKFSIKADWHTEELDLLALGRGQDRPLAGAVVSEGYLGPQRGRADMGKTLNELERLYTQVLQLLPRMVRPGGAVVLAWPQYRGRFLYEQGLDLPPKVEMEEVLPASFRELAGSTARQTLLYKRQGQMVGREILRFRVV